MKKSSSLILDSIFFEVPELKILTGAYLRLQPGEITAIIGLNGAGKSTLLKIAAGQLTANSDLLLLMEYVSIKNHLNYDSRKLGISHRIPCFLPI